MLRCHARNEMAWHESAASWLGVCLMLTKSEFTYDGCWNREAARLKPLGMTRSPKMRYIPSFACPLQNVEMSEARQLTLKYFYPQRQDVVLTRCLTLYWSSSYELLAISTIRASFNKKKKPPTKFQGVKKKKREDVHQDRDGEFVPPLHQEWAPSSNQAAVTQPGNRIPIDLDNKSSAPDTTAAERTSKTSTYHPFPMPLAEANAPLFPAVALPARTRIFIHKAAGSETTKRETKVRAGKEDRE
ncbi:hypothetical protein V8C26DRAFT_413711 [Trichoderma gracile]